MTFFKTITFKNVDKAKIMLANLKKDDYALSQKMADELEAKIKEYESFVEADTEGALR